MKLRGAYRGEVPVVENGRLAGVIWPGDVIQRYNTEIFKREMAQSMASVLDRKDGVTSVPAVKDHVVAEIPVPDNFVGRTIRELGVRQAFGVSILMIKQSRSDGAEQLDAAPGADYVFQPADGMLVMGPPEELRHLKTGAPRSER